MNEGVMTLALTEQGQHDILLLITAALFVIFSTGIGEPSGISGDTVIVPPA